MNNTQIDNYHIGRRIQELVRLQQQQELLARAPLGCLESKLVLIYGAGADMINSDKPMINPKYFTTISMISAWRLDSFPKKKHETWRCSCMCSPKHSTFRLPHLVESRSEPLQVPFPRSFEAGPKVGTKIALVEVRKMTCPRFDQMLPV